MNGVLEKSAVKRVVAAKEKFGISGQIKVLTETAKVQQRLPLGWESKLGRLPPR
jgi:hypothetical protein